MEYNYKQKEHDLRLLNEFYKTYCHTQKAYDAYDNNARNKIIKLTQKINSANSNKSSAKIMIIVGIITIPIAIGILFLLAGIIIMCLSNSDEKDTLLAKQALIDEQQSIICYLQQQYNQTNKCIAFKYARPSIVNQLMNYIEYGRADSIKEALNLFENEIAIQSQQRQLQSIANASALTAKFAEQSALANTYLAIDTLTNRMY